MKVVLTGATGFVGGAVLRRLIATPQVTNITVLSRRAIPVEDAKLHTIIMKDFTTYDSETKAKLSDAEACIWCLGSAKNGADVHYDMPKAAIQAFEESVLPGLSKDKRFRFVLTSGAYVEQDQNARLWLVGGTRKMRGKCEVMAISAQERNPKTWSTVVVRPMMVTNGEPMLGSLFKSSYIPKEELAAAMVHAAMGGEVSQTMEMAELRSVGQTALKDA